MQEAYHQRGVPSTPHPNFHVTNSQANKIQSQNLQPINGHGNGSSSGRYSLPFNRQISQTSQATSASYSSYSNSQSQATSFKKQVSSNHSLRDKDIRVIGLYDFHGQDGEDLPFVKGEILTILEKQEEQWWTARNEFGDIGHVPVPYIKVFSIEGVFPV